MEEDKDKKIKINKNKLITIGIVGAALLFVIFVVLLSFKGKGTFLIQKPSQTRAPAAPLLSLKVVPLENDQPGARILLSPLSSGTTVSAFQIKLDLPSETIEKEISVIGNPELEKQGWRFPLLKIQRGPSGEVFLKLAAFRMGNSPFIVDKEMLFFLIISKVPLQGLPTISPSETIIYSSDAVTTIPFSLQTAN